MSLEAAIQHAKTACEGKPYIGATLAGLLHGYHERWGAQRAERAEVQLFGSLPNLKSKNNSKSRTFRLAGKLDKVAGLAPFTPPTSGYQTLYDHKTTSMDIADPAADFWRQLEIASQPNHYDVLLLENGIAVERIVWDVVRKPKIKPRKMFKKEIAELASFGTYFGRPCGSNARLGMEETVELFEARVAHLVTSEPDKYFARRSAKRSREELAEYCVELWDLAQDLVRTRREGTWYKTPGACFPKYGVACRFLGICAGHDSPDSDRWRIADCVHDELELEGDGRDLLTNSRVECFKECRRKHYYQYELGIRRVDREEVSAPLTFGTLWHECMDRLWGTND